MNPVLLQKQLKENASDLQVFCKELESWGDEMKRKEESLKKNEGASKKSKPHNEKTSPTVKEEQGKKISKIGSTDYAAWDKFDADAECERLEEDIKDDSELTDEFEENIRDEALVYKDKGNSYVKTKQWDKAIEFYTKAITCYSYDPVFFANRGLCHLKKENFTAAEEDCTLSLKLDSTYVKALQRRSAARENLGKLDVAENDLLRALQQEPNNKESKTALERVRKKIGPKVEVVDEQRPVSKFTASRNKTQSFKPTISNISLKPDSTKPSEKLKIDTSNPSTSIWPDIGDIIPVKSIDKPVHLRSKKPLKRIEITEESDSFIEKIDNEVPEKLQIGEPEAMKRHVVEKIERVGVKEREPEKVDSSFKMKREQIKHEKSGKVSENAWPKPNEFNSVIKSDDLRILEKKSIVENTPKDVKNSENFIKTKMENKNNVSKVATEAVEEFPVPKNSIQFYSAWKNLKTSEDKFKYLKRIKPEELPNIFREALETRVFSGFLDVLSTHFIENKENVYDFLVSLTQVKRFSAFTMFMDYTDKNRLWKMISYLREQGAKPKEEIDSLVEKYEL